MAKPIISSKYGAPERRTDDRVTNNTLSFRSDWYSLLWGLRGSVNGRYLRISLHRRTLG